MEQNPEHKPKEPTATEIDEAVGSAERQVEKFLFENEEGQSPRFKHARERKMRESLETTQRQMAGAERPIPKSGFIPPKRAVRMPGPLIDHVKRAGATRGTELELQQKGLDALIQEWIKDNPDYEFKNIDVYTETEINYEEKSPNLTPQFIDHLIGIAKRQTGMKHLLEDIRKIKVYSGERQIVLGLRGSDNELTRLYFKSKPPFDLVLTQR